MSYMYILKAKILYTQHEISSLKYVFIVFFKTNQILKYTFKLFEKNILSPYIPLKP